MARYQAEGARQREVVGERNAAIYYAGDKTLELSQPANATLAPGLSEAMAKRLGIDRSRPLTVGDAANLLAGLTAQGAKVDGKRYRSAGTSLGEIFGIGPEEAANGRKKTTIPLLTPEQLAHALAGRRVDGSPVAIPPGKTGRRAEDAMVGAQHRLRAALGLPAEGEPTSEHLANLADRKQANGQRLDLNTYRRAITGKGEPIGFVDITWSASKAISTAYATAKTPELREMYVDIVERAAESAMRWLTNDEIGQSRDRRGGGIKVEQAEAAWFSYTHDASRPVLKVVRKDENGHLYTDMQAVPGPRADPQLHVHALLLSHLLQRNGRITALDLNRLEGRVHTGGAIFQAYSARFLREAGFTIVRGEHGDAQIVGVDQALQRFFSKRHNEAELEAERLAGGPDAWAKIKAADQQIEFLTKKSAELRRDKSTVPVAAGHERWSAEAVEAGFNLPEPNRQRRRPELSRERRAEVGYELAQPAMAELFQRRKAVATGEEIRLIAARTLLTAGISDNAKRDIDDITKLVRERGIHHGAFDAALVWQASMKHGRERTLVTTDTTRMTEEDVVSLTKRLTADRSTALPAAAIDRAAEAYLNKHPEIDRNGQHWQEQMAWAHRLGEAGRMAIGIGVAGAGKSTVVDVIADAARAESRTVFASALSWDATHEMQFVPPGDHRAALDRMFSLAAQGKTQHNSKSMLFLDEVGLLGNAQMRRTLRLIEKTGASVILTGDPTQCRSPGADVGDPIELIAASVPGSIPELTRSIRQKTMRGLAVAAAFRSDPAAGLAMKIEDGTAELVAGGEDAVIKRAVELWRSKQDANKDNPSYTFALQAETNAMASAVSRSIRADRKGRGEIGPDQIDLDVMDYSGPRRIPIAVGDELRVFKRIGTLAANNQTVTVRSLDTDGMVVRNTRTGDEGRVAWHQLQKAPGGPVWLTYSGCATIDSTQAKTVSEAALIIDKGSSANKIYTAISRDEHGSTLLINEAAFRARLFLRAQVTGKQPDFERDDVWRAVAASISRPDTRLNAITAMAGKVFRHYPSRHDREVDREGLRLGAYARTRIIETARHVVQKVRDLVQQPERNVADLVRRQERRQDRGRGMSR